MEKNKLLKIAEKNREYKTKLRMHKPKKKKKSDQKETKEEKKKKREKTLPL